MRKTRNRPRRASGKLSGLGLLFGIIGLGALGLITPALYMTSKTIGDLLGENKQLKENIENLTTESQIGYAKVIEQFQKEDTNWTRLLFATTDRENPREILTRREYEIEGNVVHFDALIVKFTEPLVMDGKERAIYLWRRIYGEHMNPEEGFPIEEAGVEPARYREICGDLPDEETELFWEEIWKLANDPDRLSEKGIQAVYGNAVYQDLQPGLIYVFKINNSGDLYPEIIPDL